MGEGVLNGLLTGVDRELRCCEMVSSTCDRDTRRKSFGPLLALAKPRERVCCTFEGAGGEAELWRQWRM